MAGFSRKSSIQAVRLRVARLDSAGAPSAGADNLLVTDGLVRFGWAMQVVEGTNIRKKLGNGGLCAAYTGFDQIEGVNLNLEVCALDHELVHMLTGASLVTEGGEPKGWALPTTETDLTGRVSVEAWSLAWEGRAQATDSGNSLHHRYIAPSTSWVFGDGEANEENFLAVTLTGKGRDNSAFGDGPGNDLPYDEYLTAFGIYTDDQALPAATDGLAALVAS